MADVLFEEATRIYSGTNVPAVDALGLFYDFRELTPPGRRGDEMIRRLSDRLVSVDLLDQAADLLQHQVDHRLQGAARAQVAEYHERRSAFAKAFADIGTRGFLAHGVELLLEHGDARGRVAGPALGNRDLAVDASGVGTVAADLDDVVVVLLDQRIAIGHIAGLRSSRCGKRCRRKQHRHG